MKISLLVVVIVIVAVVVAVRGTVLTPFGHRPSECVIEVPSGSKVTPADGNKLLIEVPNEDGTFVKSYYEAPAHCGDDMNEVYQRNIKKTAGPIEGKDGETNGWLDYVGVYPPSPENNIRTFTSTYVVPGDPTNNNGNQVLFYFIGMQDNDDPTAVNILQPVLTWGNGYNQWYIKSWICCPKNITVSSPPIFGLNAGSQFQGIITRESASNWKVDSIFNGQHTTLNSDVGDYIYNWADITLEVYYVNGCTDFARGKAFFNNLVLVDSLGQRIQPTWQDYSGQTLCGGSVFANGADSYVIEHTNA